MATATVVRPPQALRNRRDAPRPSISKRQNTMDGAAAAEPASKKRKLAEPYVRDSQYILTKHQGKPPSLVVHLYDTTFRFEGQDISWTYDSPMKCVIQHLRRHTVPHEMMEELLSPVVQWYDGCLIVEVQNHRTKEGRENRRQVSGTADGQVRFSMHNYTPHITPSPMVPFPSKAVNDEATENGASSSADMPAPERPKDKDKAGPVVTTVVLHPTPLSQHHEVLILMRTPAEQMRNKKRSTESAANAAGGQPSTAQVSVAPTALTQTSRGPLAPSQKMCLEEGDLYSFQADLLVSTEPPLYLDPVGNPQDAGRVLDMLQHPLHQAQPPSPKTRKRTTAEVAADDAQAAETERRMLIMDERIKPAGAGAGANENQSAAASLGFSRFKTIEMVRQKHEEADRQKKEDEARAAMEKKQLEEQNAAQQRHEQLAAKQRQMQLLQQQQQAQAAQQAAAVAAQQQRQQPMTEQQQLAMQQMRAEQLRARQALNQQQQMLSGATHGHPQQNGLLPNGQPGFQQGNQVSMPQSSPIVQQQTPMMNSSPMVAQGGFPMVATSSQGAGSPPRPTSMAVPNGMSRQTSQQHPGSRNNTPQIPQGTPGVIQAVPNRAPTQTPRMQPSSPAAAMQQQGTPTSMSIPMQTPQMGNQVQYTPEQLQLAGKQQRIGQFLQQIAAKYNSQQQRVASAMQQAQAAGNVAGLQNLQAEMNANKAQYEQSRAALLQQRSVIGAQMAASSNQAGSPGSMQQPTPQMAHAHPQQAQQPNGMPDTNNSMQMAHQKAQHLAAVRQNAQAQQQQAQQRFQAQITNLARQYGGYTNIPQQVLSTLPPPVQNMVQSMALRQQAMRSQAQAQQAAMRATAAQQQQAQAQQHNGSELVPGSQPNPQYMQQLRTNQAMLQQQMAHGQQQGGMNTLGIQSFTMNGAGGGGNAGFAGSPGAGGNDLSQQFAAMQNALNQQQQQQQHAQQQQQHARQQQGGPGAVQ